MAYYMDLFKADPLVDPESSVLEAITGSATRQDVTASMTQAVLPPFYRAKLLNLDVITVAAASESVTNISFVALYDAATGGNLLFSAALGTFPRTIGKDNPVQFDALALAFTFRLVQLAARLSSIAGLDANLTVQAGSETYFLMWGSDTLAWGADQLIWGP